MANIAESWPSWLKIGVELEGGWNEEPDNAKRDGSVNDALGSVQEKNYACSGNDTHTTRSVFACSRAPLHSPTCGACTCNRRNVGAGPHSRGCGVRRLVCDATVVPCDGTNCRNNGNWLPGFAGELASPVLSSYQEFLDFMINHPDRVDATCGMHVHVSYNDSNVPLEAMLTPRFYETFTSKLRGIGLSIGIPQSDQFWTRLNGGNSYCRPGYAGGPDMGQRGRSSYSLDLRYAIINGLSSAPTVEIRVLPMFSEPDRGRQVIEAMLNMLVDEVENGNHVAQGVITCV